MEPGQPKLFATEDMMPTPGLLPRGPIQRARNFKPGHLCTEPASLDESVNMPRDIPGLFRCVLLEHDLNAV